MPVIRIQTREWIGIPFAQGGRDRATGMDCLGVVVAYLRAHGATIPDTAAVHVAECEPEFLACWREVDVAATPKPFMVLVAPGVRGTLHVGVVTPRGGVLTSIPELGSVCLPMVAFKQLGPIREAYECLTL